MTYATDYLCDCGCPLRYDDLTAKLVCTSEQCGEEYPPPEDMPRPADWYGR